MHQIYIHERKINLFRGGDSNSFFRIRDVLLKMLDQREIRELRCRNNKKLLLFSMDHM